MTMAPDTASLGAADLQRRVTPAPHRLEGRDKVTGNARYTDDIRLPGMLWAKALRSPYPHARIKRIDIRAAQTLPGVHAVMSVENAPEIPWYDRGSLFDRTLRFVGDEVAVVAADSEAIARDALALIDVEYEQFDFVASLAQARGAHAPLVHADKLGNLVDVPRVEQRGNIRKGMRDAELIIDRVYTTPCVLHNAMEAHGSVAAWNGDKLTLYTSTQGMFAVRSEVAGKLGIEEDKVRVMTEHMGGGFGAKQIAWKPDVIAALLARQTRRPVRMLLDREAENLAAGNRNATRQHLRIGATREGVLTAICADIDVQIGAYRAGGEESMVDGIYHTLYACANVRTQQSVMYTHTGPSVAFRAPGYVEGCFALESAMDELARALNIDPIELRLRNYASSDQRRRKPYTLPEGLERCYEQVRTAIGWDRYPRGDPTSVLRRGIGFAAHDWVGGAGHPPGKIRLSLRADGRFQLATGVQDIGTGTRTALAQIAGDTLGVDVDRIIVALGDTDSGLPAPVSSGSSTLPTLAPPVQEAAAALRRSVLSGAARLMACKPEDLMLQSDSVVSKLGASIRLDALHPKLGRRELQASGRRSANKRAHSIRTCGAQCVEVEVDTATAHVKVTRVAASHECGRIVHATLADSQVIGGIMQGLGFALMERRIIDPASGRVLNANLEDYKVPTIADTPHIEHARLDLRDELANAAGVKGLGEPPIIPTAPAITNAIFDAVGVRIYDLPVDACRMLEALSGPRRGRLCDRGDVES